MPWFLVDDGFYDHPKADAAGDLAIGLWTRAGSYCQRYLTDGFVSDAALKKLRAKPGQIRALVDAGLWVKVDGGYRFHQYLDRNRSKVQVEADRAAAADRQRRRRSRPSDDAPESPPADSTSRRMSRRESHDPGQARPGQARYLLTLVSRLAAGNARDGQPPAGEVIASWQELAGTDVDLDAEALAYLQRFGDRPADDERGAWLGWLRTARRRSEARPPARSPCSRPDCHGGWLDAGDNDTPVPCPTCKPHLRPVPQPEAS